MNTPTQNTRAGYATTAADFILTAFAVVSVFYGTFTTLLCWEIAAQER